MKKWICVLSVMAVCVSLFSACGNREQLSETQRTQRADFTESIIIEPEEMVLPDNSEFDNVEVFTAKNDGAEEKYGFSEGDIYIVDVSNDNTLECDDWSVTLQVGSEFSINDLKYVGCCDPYLEPIDMEISCKLVRQSLIIESVLGHESAESKEKMYLIFVCDKFFSGKDILYRPSKQKEAYEPELRDLKQMTGEIVLDKRVTEYSEGLCWCVLKYKDTDATFSAIVDTDGNIISTMYEASYESYGEFQNGLSLVGSADKEYYYIDKQGKTIYSTDDAEYGDYIQGVFDGGYMFLLKNEADLESNVTYYAIIDCYGEFVVDWTDYNAGLRLFDHMGDGTFSFLDKYRDSDRNNVSASFFSAKTGKWTAIPQYGTEWDGILAPTIRNQTDNIAMDSDGWIMVESDHDLITINVHSGEAIRVESKWTYDMSGEYGDGGYVLVKTGHNDQIEKLAFFDTGTKSIVPIEYEYIALVQKPESERLDVRTDVALEFGAWPAYNMPGSTSESLMQNDSFYVHYSHLHELRFSEGAMMLQLRGKDGLNYYTLIDMEGNSIIEPTPGEAIKTLGNGKFLICCDGEYRILNNKGDEVEIAIADSLIQLYSADEYKDGLCWVETDKGNAYIDGEGNYVFGEKEFGDDVDDVIVFGLSVTRETIKLEQNPESEDGLEYVGSELFKYRYEIICQDEGDERACVSITEYIGQQKKVVIPAEIDGLPVLKIGESAFKGAEIEELYFDATIAEIGAFAFADCVSLKNVELPDNRMVLCAGCFSGCDLLAELVVPADAVFANQSKVWNEELGVYEYIVNGAPVDEEDTTVIVYRGSQ